MPILIQTQTFFVNPRKSKGVNFNVLPLGRTSFVVAARTLRELITIYLSGNTDTAFRGLSRTKLQSKSRRWPGTAFFKGQKT